MTSLNHRSAHGAAKERRLDLLVGQEAVVAQLEGLLFEHDSVGINFEDNTDEYRSEAETITLRRAEARSVDDLHRIIHEEFVTWFGTKTAGPRDRYAAIARELWMLWNVPANGCATSSGSPSS